MTGIVFIDVFAVIAVVVGGLAAAAKATRVLKQFGDTLDDWRGEPERPGVPGRPGVMTRLAKIEAELRPNHGSSLRDAVNRIEAAVQRIGERFDRHLREHHGVE